MKEILIPKAQLLPMMEGDIIKGLQKDLKKLGKNNIVPIAVEWSEDGIIIFYEENEEV